jgi:pimeloyl-ACP methyl ester carboxylesterase
MSGSTVSVGDQTLAYRSSSGSGRPVVFVHGNSSSAATWAPLLDSDFGRRYHCLAVDLPGHGQSPPAADPATYSLPGYAGLVTGFVTALGLPGAVYVGWSLGGHILLEAAPDLPDPAGLAIFGAPPVADAADMATAFLPNPAMAVGFSPQVEPAEARAYAVSFLAPGSALPLDGFVADILATDGTARAALYASLGAGRFRDEAAVVASLPVPLAVLHGTGEQLVSLAYLRGRPAPTLWRGEVQLIDQAGHAPHQEQPHEFAALLSQFIDDCAARP